MSALDSDTAYLLYGNNTSLRQGIKKHVVRSVEKNTDNSSIRKNSARNTENDKYNNKCLILIHGGAWRDINNTSDDFNDFVKYWREYSTIDNFIVYSLDYKLSCEEGGHFPNLVLEILQAIHTVKKDCEKDCVVYEYTLCGHSVGSTIITQVLEYNDILDSEGIKFETTLPAVNNVILLDGIYNIPLLVEEYPDYGGFVAEHFGSVDKAKLSCNSLSSGRSLSKESLDRWNSVQQVVVIQSTKDELLSEKQSKDMEQWLYSIGCSVDSVYDDFGMHNEVYRNSVVAKLVYNYIC